VTRAVIVGAGQTGATAAATLRDQGFEGEIVLLGAEHRPPYERPPLSKEYLRGEQTLERGYLRPDAWWAEQEIQTRFGTTAERLDTSAREVVLTDGERIAFDLALIATGSRNRHLRTPGVDLPGVFGLRSADDAVAIREAAEGAARAVIVGMGFIGAEVAASLRHLGLEVTVVEFAATPLERVLGADLGSVLERLHRDHGVEMFFRDGAERF
jgi:3-phenylpropionate/trans-cinnamate dioxygenase ferredoxin reductase subunit